MPRSTASRDVIAVVKFSFHYRQLTAISNPYVELVTFSHRFVLVGPATPHRFRHCHDVDLK